MLATLAFAATALLAGCTMGEDVDEPALTDDWADQTGCEGKCDSTTGEVPRVAAPDVLLNDPVLLAQLEADGFGLGRALGGDSTNTATLKASSTRFTALTTKIEQDLAAARTADREAGVGLAYAHRQFDAQWLASTKAQFKLVGIVNRLDLAHRTPSACGEVRFIYRLSYTTAQGSSRLPMTLNVVHDQATVGGSCAPVAQAWRSANGQRAAVSALLAPYRDPARVEMNLQAVRWPAVTRADMGGYAEYLMRVFTVSGGSLTPQALPDTIRTNLNPADKAELAAWITANIDAIDRGDAVIPTKFLNTKATSVSPRGLARGANRLYLTVFPEPEQTFGDLDYASLSLIKSPGGLIRKLDTMTCQGCHQSRGLAGFHLLGEEEAGQSRGNAIEVGSSPHLNDELAWRQQAQADVAAGDAIEAPRPYAERSATTIGTYGAHCDLAGDPSFRGWTCASGFTCKDLSGEEIGMCVTAEAPQAGDTCETSTVSFNADPKLDRVSDFATQQCGVMPTGRRAYCNHSGTKPFTTSNFGGFPNGSCSSPCLTMGLTRGDTICGAQPPNGFNDCLGAGTDFTTCLANATPEFRRRCDARTPCGDDYVCAGVIGAPKGVGACMPPYFIFQVRVDGHAVR